MLRLVSFGCELLLLITVVVLVLYAFGAGRVFLLSNLGAILSVLLEFG